jgi:hypothetical protein
MADPLFSGIFFGGEECSMRVVRFLLASGGVACASMLAFLACTQEKPSNAFETRDDDAGRTRDPEETTKGESDPVLPDGTKPPGRVYAHTRDELYLYDPLAKKLTDRGPFTCLKTRTNTDGDPQKDRVLDLAIDRDGVVYATSDYGFLKITNPDDASCTYVRESPTSGAYPNSLAFVPIGTVDDTQETLVGYTFEGQSDGPATVYTKIDTRGMTTAIGNLNPAGAAVRWRSSGDILSTIRNGNHAYLTVRKLKADGTDDVGTDSLAEVNPKTGTIIKIIGDTKANNLYGFGQWAGTGYAFAGNGDVVAIDLATGAAARVFTLATEAGAGEVWFGAGVTTDAPTKP